MYCYECGALLTENDYCTACGADVAVYKQILEASNRLYNEGLDRAGVRDLTGAADILRQSLKLNKNNIEARNLLGLVYFEMGETAAALSEWVISQNFRKEKNIASDYIALLQGSRMELDAINQSIQKYNTAYEYCRQGSTDLAIIQLKKVVSTNPRFLRALQLLALIYIDAKDFEKAETYLSRCLRVDRGNTTAQRYLREIEGMLGEGDEEKKPGLLGSDEVTRYKSGNELIIQPANVREPKSGSFGTLLNILIGLIIGAAAMYFLVIPAREAQGTGEEQEVVKGLGEQLDAKTAALQELEAQVAALQRDKTALEDVLESYTGEDGTLENIALLLDAAAEYLTSGDKAKTAELLEEVKESVDLEEMSESFRNLYDTLLGQIGPELAQEYYDSGFAAFRSNDFETAVTLLSRSVHYAPERVDGWYNLGNAYRNLQDTENARAAYEKVIELAPDTTEATRSQQFIDQMEASGG